MIFRLIFALAIFFTFQPASAREIYHVTGIDTFVSAKDSNTARDLAMEAGEKKAYAELVKRFLDYGYMDSKPNLSDKQVDQIISRMQVKDEKITDKTYGAKLDFWFNPIKTANYFKIKHREGNPTRTKYLVIPVIVEGTSMQVWEHQWLDSWAGYRKKNLLVPLGDLDDMTLLKAKDVEKGDYKGVDALARRYKSPLVVIAKAEYIALDNSVKVKLERLDGNDNQFYEFDYPGGFGVGAYELYDTAANDILYRLENNKLTGEEQEEKPKEEPDYYRNYDSERANKFKTLKATVLAQDLAEWSRVRRDILKSEYIKELKVNSFKAGEVAVMIKYNGTLSQLDTALDLHGLNLESDANSRWTISESLKSIIEEDIIPAQEAPKVTRKHRYIKDE